jgi:hypothetical protein
MGKIEVRDLYVEHRIEFRLSILPVAKPEFGGGHSQVGSEYLAKDASGCHEPVSVGVESES